MDSSIKKTPRSAKIQRVKALGCWVRVAIWPGDRRDQPPLVLFNGIGAQLELLQPLAESLDGIEVIGLDVPGSGTSPAPLHPYRMWMMAALVSQVLTTLGYDRVDVLGVSWGGTLAQQFALQNPRRCRRLILAATAGFPIVPGNPSLLFKMMTPRRHSDAVYRRKIAGDIYGGRIRREPALIREVGARMQLPSVRGYIYQQLALTGWVSLPWLPLLRQQTLIMSGDDDPVIPLINGRILAKLIPHSHLHVMRDNGHLFLVTDAEESGRIVQDFLELPEPRELPAGCEQLGNVA